LKPSVYSNNFWVQVHIACGGLCSFLLVQKRTKKRHLPILSGQAAIEYSPMAGSSYVEHVCMVVNSIGSLMWYQDRMLITG